ncbi:MAG: fatty acid desaturase [Bacteroidetes bacterium]|nr:fatty acid desaturase [Bacteroidota bacterium]
MKKLLKMGWAFYLYVLIYIVPLVLVFFVPFSWSMVGLFFLNYFIGMFFITAGYHRYFSHKSYKLARIPQFILAFMAQASCQKGVLWWAANHRHHHIYSDKDEDIHSPVKRGFWYSHIGWVFDPVTQGYNERQVADLSKFAELRFLNKYFWLPTVIVAAAILYFGGLSAFVWGYLITMIMLYQASYCVNSLAHVYGTKRFDTGDESRNNWILAIITLGEGWHNNHHHSMASVRQGYKWWEIDITFYILTIFSWIGIVKDMRPFKV